MVSYCTSFAADTLDRLFLICAQKNPRLVNLYQSCTTQCYSTTRSSVTKQYKISSVLTRSRDVKQLIGADNARWHLHWLNG